MKQFTVDVAVIGAGTAGLAAYRAAVAAGKRVVIIESGPYGTTCARVGCMPSKLLIAAAEAVHTASRWSELGIRLDGSVTIDGQAVMARVRRERDRFVGFALQQVEMIPEHDKICGYARFAGDRTLLVDDHTRLAFAQAVITTGSAPSVPGMLRFLGDRVIVNDDVFDWDDLPMSVAVFGPGVIGLELAQALHRLGVKVLMFGKDHLVGPFSDREVRAYATRTFQEEFYLDANAEVRALARMDNGVTIRYVDHAGNEQSATVDYVIAATGRAPNIRNLGLDHTSLKLDAQGVPIFDRHTLQCGDSPIFIAGDANNDLLLLHEAADEGRIAGENAARYPDVRPGLRRTPLAIVFSDPQLAVIGMRHADLAPDSFVTGAASFEDQGRSRIMLRNQGLLHVYADAATGLLRGAEMIGPEAEHLGHLLAWAIQAGLTVAQTLEMPFYHPVVEEGLRTALRDAQAGLVAFQSRARRI
ncbi:MAG: dihydrolipoyl dehydrogenase [Sulfuricaulis sp.]